MLVELGNTACTTTDHSDPVVTYMNVPDTYSYTPAYDDGKTQLIGRDREVDVKSASELALEAAAHIGRSLDGVTHIPEQEALLAVVASWRAESNGLPSWVWSDNEDFAVLLASYFGCELGRPDDLEDVHHTLAGPPGVHPEDNVPDVPAEDPEPEPEAPTDDPEVTE